MWQAREVNIPRVGKRMVAEDEQLTKLCGGVKLVLRQYNVHELKRGWEISW